MMTQEEQQLLDGLLVDGDDDDVFFPGTRIAWEAEDTLFSKKEVAVVEGEEDGEEPSPPPIIQPAMTFFGEYVQGRGESTQQLGPGDMITLDGRSIGGRIRNDFDLNVGTVGLSGGLKVFDRVRLEGLVQMAAVHVDLESRRGAQKVTDDATSWGVGFGARGAWQPLEWFDIYGQWVMHVLVSDGVLETSFRTYEGGIGIRPVPYVRCFAGWRRWDYDDEDSFDSRADLEMSGPTLGVGIEL